jgi:hypothetical protein
MEVGSCIEATEIVHADGKIHSSGLVDTCGELELGGRNSTVA